MYDDDDDDDLLAGLYDDRVYQNGSWSGSDDDDYIRSYYGGDDLWMTHFVDKSVTFNITDRLTWKTDVPVTSLTDERCNIYMQDESGVDDLFYGTLERPQGDNDDENVDTIQYPDCEHGYYQFYCENVITRKCYHFQISPEWNARIPTNDMIIGVLRSKAATLCFLWCIKQMPHLGQLFEDIKVIIARMIWDSYPEVVWSLSNPKSGDPQCKKQKSEITELLLLEH